MPHYAFLRYRLVYLAAHYYPKDPFKILAQLDKDVVRKGETVQKTHK